MNSRRLAAVCACVLTLMIVGLWHAPIVNGDDWQPISPEELKMTSLPEAPGAPAVILYRQVDRDDTRPPHEITYIRMKILAEDGRKYGNVEIPFLKESATVHGVKARSIRTDGSIAQFDGRCTSRPL